LEVAFIAQELGFGTDQACRDFFDSMVHVEDEEEDQDDMDDEEVAKRLHERRRRAALPLYTDHTRVAFDTKATLPLLVHQMTEL
jgi:hypothetical protein